MTSPGHNKYEEIDSVSPTQQVVRDACKEKEVFHVTTNDCCTVHR